MTPAVAGTGARRSSADGRGASRRRCPDALPSHIDLTDGVVQVGDEGAFGSGGWFITSPDRVDIDQLGPSASRTVSDQWGTDAVSDPQRLTGTRARAAETGG